VAPASAANSGHFVESAERTRPQPHLALQLRRDFLLEVPAQQDVGGDDRTGDRGGPSKPMLAKSRVTSLMCDGGDRREWVSLASGRLAEPIADGTHGLDPITGRAELGAQSLHVHVHGACLNVRLCLPDRFEQL